MLDNQRSVVQNEKRQGDSAPGGRCQPPSVLPQFASETLGVDPPNGDRFTAWGVAGPSVARLELRARGAVVATTPAISAPLPGAAADLRFWAVDVADVRPLDEIALLDDAGVVRRALDPGSDYVLHGGSDSAPASPRGAVLQSGRRGGTTWRLRRVLHTGLAPTPLEPERHEEQRCVTFTSQIKANGGVLDGPCDRPALATSPLSVRYGEECGLGAYLMVLVRAPVRSVYAVLGDGTRRTARLSPLGGIYENARAGLLAIGEDLAIRRVVAIGAGGRTVAHDELRQAPPGPTSCSDESRIVSSGGDPGLLFRSERLRGGSHTAHAADWGALLCVAVDHAPRIPDDCALPPVDPAQAPVVSFAAAGDRRFLYGVVPAEVTQARVTLDDHSVRTIDAAPITGYAGPYAAVLRQVSLNVPSGRDAVRVALLDAQGRDLGGDVARDLLSEVRFGPSVTLAPASDGIAPVRARRLDFFDGSQTCVTVLRSTFPVGCDASADTTDHHSLPLVHLSVQCAPRRTVVLAILPHRDDRLVLGLRGGRHVTARQIRIRGAVGPATGRSATLAVLGPHVRLAEVRLRGRSPAISAARLPAAADQCGYSADVLFHTGR